MTGFVPSRREFLGRAGRAVSATVLGAGLTAAFGPPGLLRRAAAQAPGGAGAGPPRIGVISSLSLHPSRPVLASGGDTHEVGLWNAATGAVDHRLPGHRDWVRGVAFSPDGQALATVGGDGVAILWQYPSLRPTAMVPVATTGLGAVAWHPTDGRLAVGTFEGDLIVLAGGQVVATIPRLTPDIRTIAFSSDGATVACGGRTGAVATLSWADPRPTPGVRLHRGRVRGLTAHPAGDGFLSCGEDRTLGHVPAAGRPATLHAFETKLACIAVTETGRAILGGTDNRVHVWDLAGGSLLAPLEGHTGSVVALATGRGMLYSAGYDTTVRVWDLADVG